MSTTNFNLKRKSALYYIIYLSKADIGCVIVSLYINNRDLAIITVLLDKDRKSEKQKRLWAHRMLKIIINFIIR